MHSRAPVEVSFVIIPLSLLPIPATQGNLASAYCTAGAFDKAEPLLLSAYQTQLMRFGVFHEGTLDASNNLSCCYINVGKLSDAQVLLEDALAIYKDIKVREPARGTRYSPTYMYVYAHPASSSFPFYT